MRKIITMLIISLSFSACTDKVSPVAKLSGTFDGTFFYRPASDLQVQSGSAKISFSENRYVSARNATYIPAGGSGTLEILMDDLISFKDENIWTANFDWGLVLNGNFKYRFKGDSLILTRRNDTCPNCKPYSSPLYEYRLKRSN